MNNNSNNKSIVLNNYNLKSSIDKNNNFYYIIFDNNQEKSNNAYFIFNGVNGYDVVDRLFIGSNSVSDVVKDIVTPLQVEYVENIRDGKTNRKVTVVFEVEK